MSSRFEERLRTGPPIVADGGMGTLLSGAVPRLRCPEEANLRAPESVVALHASFIRAGAELIETNTFGANRRKLAAHFLEDELEQINSTAVRLAREAREVSGADVFIAGSIGPLGELERFDAEQSALFAEQAQVLEGRGVDLLMLETFFDLDELVAAIAAVRSVSSLPIVALMTFDADGQTLGGVSAEDAADRLAGLGVAAAGANHSAGPAAALNALAAMQRDGLVLAALPNVGLASLAGSRVVFPHATPEYFAEFAAQARRLGAGIIGGCCGTTPAQIEAIRTAIDEERAPAAPFVVRERALAEAAEAATEETNLARMLREQEFVVSVQLDPPLGANNSALIEAGRTLRESGKAHFVDVNDNPRARARMSGIMASVAIEREAGIETIPHLTTRDMSIAGLESLLLGAHAEGLHNVLAVTGDPPEEGDYPGARGVYEVDAIGLTRLVSGLNRGEDYHGRGIDAPTSFFVGVAVNPSADDLDLELERFERKLEAGAQFAMTQVLFDLAYLDSFLAHYGGRSPIPLLVGVWPLPSQQLARPDPQRGAGDRRPRPGAGAAARRGRRRGGGRPRAGARADRGVAREGGGRLRRRAVPAAARHPRRPLTDAGAGRHLARAGVREGLAHERGRDAVAGRRADPRREDRRLHAALPVDRRSAGVAVPDDAAQSRDRAADRAAAVGVVGEDDARLADPAGRRRERAVLRVAEDRDRLALDRIDEPERRRTEAVDPQHGDVVPRVEGDDDGVAVLPVAAVDARVLLPATTCAVVTTRPGAAIQPEPSMPRPHAVPGTRTTLGRAATTPALWSSRGSGGPTRASGPRWRRTGRRARSRRAAAMAARAR